MEIPFTFGGCQYMCSGFKKKFFPLISCIPIICQNSQAPGLRSDLELTWGGAGKEIGKGMAITVWWSPILGRIRKY